MFKIGKGTDMENVRTGDKTCEMRGFGIATEEGRTRQGPPGQIPDPVLNIAMHHMKKPKRNGGLDQNWRQCRFESELKKLKKWAKLGRKEGLAHKARQRQQHC